MPVTSCPSCKSRFKVPVQTVGKTVRCPRCKDEFHAVALHSVKRKAHGTKPWMYGVIAVAALLVATLIRAMSSSSDIAPEEEPRKPAVTQKKDRGASNSPSTYVSKDPKNLLIARAQKALDAMRNPEHPLLPGWIDYRAIHSDRRSEGLENITWDELQSDEEYAKREEYLDLVIGDAQTRKFTRTSTVQSIEVLRMGSGVGKIRAELKDTISDETQVVTIEFAASSGNWKIAGIERVSPNASNADSDALDRTLARVSGRRGNQEGSVSPVAVVENTPSAVNDEIGRLVTILNDITATVEATRARSKLLEIGKPSIPFLLNCLVPLDLKDPNELLVANRISTALGELTGEDFRILPGTNIGSVTGEGSEENERSRRLWFGWWRANKDSYRGPVSHGFEDEEDQDNRR